MLSTVEIRFPGASPCRSTLWATLCGVRVDKRDDQATVTALWALGAGLADAVEWSPADLMNRLGVDFATAQAFHDQTRWTLADVGRELGMTRAAALRWRGIALRLRRAEASARETARLAQQAAVAAALAGHARKAVEQQALADEQRVLADKYQHEAEAAETSALPAPSLMVGRERYWYAGLVRMWAVRTGRLTADLKPTGRWQKQRHRPAT